jgi:hypothetical protein
MVDFQKQVLTRLERIEMTAKFQPAWISGYVALGRYLGWNDAKGRKAKAWVEAESIYTKWINGTPTWKISDIEKAMRNGVSVELPKKTKKADDEAAA